MCYRISNYHSLSQVTADCKLIHTVFEVVRERKQTVEREYWRGAVDKKVV
jgi:hypothetical protein